MEGEEAEFVEENNINDNAADAVENVEDNVVHDGCAHYRCRCAYVAPCCNKVYTCRVCHDENESHEIDRHAVMEIVCLICDQRQPVSNECTSCGVEFGLYFCLICRLFDDVDKGQFHCDKCGICRVGGINNFFHCPKCDMCLGIGLQNSHKCVERVTHSNCPVCMELLHTSRMDLAVLPCGHMAHVQCKHGMLRSGNTSCPLCGQSMIDMKECWERFDFEVANTQMPDEYKDTKLWILCRDCHQTSEVLFHVVGLKCLSCGSYNTCRTSEPVDRDGAARPSPEEKDLGSPEEDPSLPDNNPPSANAPSSNNNAI